MEIDKYQIGEDGELTEEWKNPPSRIDLQVNRFFDWIDNDPAELLHLGFELTVIPILFVIGPPWIFADWVLRQLKEHHHRKTSKEAGSLKGSPSFPFESGVELPQLTENLDADSEKLIK